MCKPLNLPQPNLTESHRADESDLRKPTIFSDAILAMIESPPEEVTGQCFLNEDFLRDYEKIKDFEKYSCVPGASPWRIMPASFPDLRVAEQDDEGTRDFNEGGEAFSRRTSCSCKPLSFLPGGHLSNTKR
jgi:hypothetical protein